MPHQHHTIDYIELAVTDMAATQDFYSSAFGWAFTDYGPEYAGIQRPGGAGEVGGLRLAECVTTGGPLVILYSDDIVASERAVRDAGGTIVVETFDFPGGRRFQFRDPSGNELAVWSPPLT
ncbi:Glyoxalase-like domain protein [Planctomycetes bacterium Pla163]|uniref:Glyoxalase-like domain protein n=1 Tax=Rohdeia mirabilis TaxID=2528008 RepID=A0A518CV62_9BACT|nr:Glyoxalase-like domain protein [Planctomycetes bacterium Pla163]